MTVNLAIDSINKTELPVTRLEDRIPVVRPNWSFEQKYLRGVFAGGTFCYQSQQGIRNADIRVFSNTPIDKANKLDHPRPKPGEFDRRYGRRILHGRSTSSHDRWKPAECKNSKKPRIRKLRFCCSISFLGTTHRWILSAT